MILKTRTLQFFLLLAIIAFILGTNIAVVRYFDAALTAEQARGSVARALLNEQMERLDQAELKINALVDENDEVAMRIQDEIQKRLLAEAARTNDQKKIQQLENNQTDLALLISKWRSRVPLVQCQYNSNGIIMSSSGSGVLFDHVSRNNNFGIVTNRHVVNKDGLVPTQCIIIFPGSSGDYTINPETIEVPIDGSDWAIIEMTSLSSSLRSVSATSADRCSSAPALGNEVIILGYPSIGSQTDITATEGIISGFDGEYFITSAKVERGNSGGAAVLVRQQCYLGIPSFVGTGAIESLARILDQKIIFK